MYLKRAHNLNDNALILTLLAAGLSCEDGMIRLSPDGPSRIEGRVEMCYQNIWGAVYDQSWSGFDAAVVCAQLNFSRTGEKKTIFSKKNFSPFFFLQEHCQ